MRFKTAISNNRRRKSGGQAIVENALTLIPMLTMIFGMTDFGLMIFRWTTLQNAVREGTRYAVTFQVESRARPGQVHPRPSDRPTTSAWSRQADSPKTIYVKYYNPIRLCPGHYQRKQPGNVVQVSVQGVKFSWISILNGTWWSTSGNKSLTLNVYASDILGRLPGRQ